MHKTDFFLKYSDISGQVINRISFWQERSLIKNVFIICGGKITTEAAVAGFEMQIFTENQMSSFLAATQQTVFVFL